MKAKQQMSTTTNLGSWQNPKKVQLMPSPHQTLFLHCVKFLTSSGNLRGCHILPSDRTLGRLPRCLDHSCQAIVALLIAMSWPCWVQGRICPRCVIDFVSVLMGIAILMVCMGLVHNFAILLDSLSLVNPGQHFLQEG